MQLSEESLKEFKELCAKEGISYKTEAEYRQAAQNLLNFAEVVVDIAHEKLQREKRLKEHPNGFEMEGEGRNCSLCRKSVYGEEKIWFDKWGFKCKDCKDAYDKKILPGYVFKDYDNEKHITGSTLSWKFNIRTQTIRKLVRQGKLKAREIPRSGVLVFLKKENPDIARVLDENIIIKS